MRTASLLASLLLASLLLAALALPASAEADDRSRNLYVCPAGAGGGGTEPCAIVPSAPEDAPTQLPVTYRCGKDRLCGLEEFMAENRVCVLMVMHEGVVKLAATDNGGTKCRNTPTQLGPNAVDRPYGTASMAKSIASLLFGLVNARLDPAERMALDDPIVRHLPALAGHEFDAATLAHALQMASGLIWTDGTDEKKLRGSAIDEAKEPDSKTLLEAVTEIVADHGSRTPGRFDYSAVDTTLISLAAERRLAALPPPLAPRHLPALLETEIWQQAGMQDPFRWKADRTDSVAAWCCAYATPRDLLRLGQWVLEGLKGAQGAAMADWLAESAALHQADARACHGPAGKRRLGYGYQWWVFQQHGEAAADPAMGFTALGLGGQFLHVVPGSDIAIVQLSDWRHEPGGWNDDWECASYALHEALIRHFDAAP